MSKVKVKDIGLSDRYANTELFGTDNEPDKIIGNLKELYAYIDTKEGFSIYQYGNAYRKILKLARAYAGRHSRIISKRQISNLIKIHRKEDVEYVKIPYAADYIFKAIFAIFDEYKKTEDDIPEHIKNMFGLSRRDCFYKKQCDSYARVYEEGDMQIRKDLQHDINSERCALGGKV